MIDKLKVLNISTSTSDELEHSKHGFILKTCQRTLVISNTGHCDNNKKNIIPSSTLMSNDAYKFILEIICGLKSRLPAENEIMHQFKTAYAEYLKLKERDSKIMSIVERVLKDAKEVRTKYLINIGQQSYASICRQIVKKNSNTKKILILGTGSLCRDLLMLLHKKYDVYVSGRNQNAITELKNDYSFTSIDWMDLNEFKSFSTIINTIGSSDIILDNSYINNWTQDHANQNLLIDLGNPSPIIFTNSSDFKSYRLQDIFEFSEALSKEKELKIIDARIAIDKLTHKSSKYLSSQKT